MTEPPDDEFILNDHADIRARLIGQRVHIEDRSDGHFVVLEADEAKALRKWLAEIL
jgi:hypothetical protein